MRVTNNMLVMNMLTNINRNMQKMSKYQDELATGKKIQSPMDDPVGISKVLKYKTDLAELEQYEINSRDALAWLENTESSLIDMGAVLHRMRELTVQASNGTNSPEELGKIKSEILQLTDQMISDANATFAGRYIFSGFQTDQKLMKDDGTYNIDITNYDLNEKPATVYQVGVGENITVETSGVDLFGTVDLENFMSQYLTDDIVKGTAAGPAEKTGTINFTNVYASGSIQVTVNGTTYTVNDTLDGSVNEIERADVIEALDNATDGTDMLSEVANVYFNDAGELVVQSHGLGSGESISGNGTVFTAAGVAGTDQAEATYTSAAFTDADVLAATEEESYVIDIDGQRIKLTVDMSTVTTGNDLAAALNTQLDGVDGFNADLVDVTYTGTELEFATKGTPADGSLKTLEIRPIQSVQSQMMLDIDDFVTALDDADLEEIQSFLTKVDGHLDKVLEKRSDIGARVNRLNLVVNRIAENNISFTKLLSNAEDTDMSEVIMYLKNSENVYRASLQTGARSIQPTLIDFLR